MINLPPVSRRESAVTPLQMANKHRGVVGNVWLQNPKVLFAYSNILMGEHFDGRPALSLNSH